jgi:holo-[acyl-carrier protein] synthase
VVPDPRVGVDLVDVDDFAARFEGREAMLAEVFTEGELTYCRGQRHPWRHLAARFAAKEAVLKALTSGLSGAMQWRDIEVSRDPAGTPRVLVTGATGDALSRQGLRAASVSLSHARSIAIAVVVLVPA